MQLALKAIFDGARTTKDGGWNLTFSVDQSQGEQIIQTYSMKDKLLYLVVMDQESAKIAEDSDAVPTGLS